MAVDEKADIAEGLVKGLAEEKMRAWLLYSIIPQAAAPAALALHGKVLTELSVALKTSEYSIQLRLPSVPERVRCSLQPYMGLQPS